MNEEKIVRGPRMLVSSIRMKGGSRQFVDPFELMLIGNKQ